MQLPRYEEKIQTNQQRFFGISYYFKWKHWPQDGLSLIKVNIKLHLSMSMSWNKMGIRHTAPTHSFLQKQMVVRGQIHSPCCFSPGTHWVGGCMGSRTSLDLQEKRKSTALSRTWTEINQPIVQSQDWMGYPGSLRFSFLILVKKKTQRCRG